MVEAQCVEEFVLNDPMMKTAIHRQRNHLLPSISANGSPAPTGQVKDRETGLNPDRLANMPTITSTLYSPKFTLDAQVVRLAMIRNKANAGFLVESFHSFFNCGLFIVICN